MLKKLILAVILTISMSVPAMAADAFNINGLNLQGDILFLPSSGQFAVGAGTTIATIYDIFEVRGVFVDPLPDSNENKAGLGVGLNLVKVINKVGGSWLLNGINPSVGVTALTNLNGAAHIEPAVFVSAVSVQF